MSYQYVREPLTAEESDRLSKACQTPTERLVVWTLLDTGLRVGELCDLTPKNVLWQQRLAAKSMTRSRGSPDRINSQGLLSKGYLRRRIASQAGPPRDSSSERSPSWMPCLRSSIQSSGSGGPKSPSRCVDRSPRSSTSPTKICSTWFAPAQWNKRSWI